MPRPPDTLRLDQTERVRNCGAAQVDDGVNYGILVSVNDHYFVFPPNNFDDPKALADGIYAVILKAQEGLHGTATSPTAAADSAGAQPVRQPARAKKHELPSRD